MDKDHEAMIEKIAWGVGDRIAERLEIRIDEKIENHILACRTAKTVTEFKAKAGGFVLAFTMVGSFIGAAVVLGWDVIKQWLNGRN